jgi:hypothetical protein
MLECFVLLLDRLEKIFSLFWTSRQLFLVFIRTTFTDFGIDRAVLQKITVDSRANKKLHRVCIQNIDRPFLPQTNPYFYWDKMAKQPYFFQTTTHLMLEKICHVAGGADVACLQKRKYVIGQNFCIVL